jgi:hypothetical protein
MTPEQKQNLRDAYLDIYDVKDALGPDHDQWYDAYNALRYLATLMKGLGVPVPERYDGQPTTVRGANCPASSSTTTTTTGES